MLELTHELGGANYVLWGGREGYETLLNTKIGQEMDQMGRFLHLVVEHAEKIGYKGQILIEPKPQEPSKHQYDFDVATVYGFLKKYGLETKVKCNIEVGHAFLANHSFEHELALAASLGILGSVDANRNDLQSGWDTDQFPNSVPETTLAFYQILKAGGLGSGGWNFDAKVRRQSIDPADLLHGHIGGLDVLARSLKAAAAIIEDGTYDKIVDERYAGWKQKGAAGHAQGRTHARADRRLGGSREHQPAAALGPAGIPGKLDQPLRVIEKLFRSGASGAGAALFMRFERNGDDEGRALVQPLDRKRGTDMIDLAQQHPHAEAADRARIEILRHAAPVVAHRQPQARPVAPGRHRDDAALLAGIGMLLRIGHQFRDDQRDGGHQRLGYLDPVRGGRDMGAADMVEPGRRWRL